MRVRRCPTFRFVLEPGLTAVYQRVERGYIGWVEGLPGANTQGRTLAKARENMKEAVLLVRQGNRILAEEQDSTASLLEN